MNKFEKTRSSTTGQFVDRVAVPQVKAGKVSLRRAAPGEVHQSAVRMKARFAGALANLKDR